MARSRSPVLPPGAHAAHGRADSPPAYPTDQGGPQPYAPYNGQQAYDGYNYPAAQPPAREAEGYYEDPQQGHGYGQPAGGYGAYPNDPRYPQQGYDRQPQPTFDRQPRGFAQPAPAYDPAYAPYPPAGGGQPPAYPVEPVSYDPPSNDPRDWHARQPQPAFPDPRRQPAFDRGPQPPMPAPQPYADPQADLRGGHYDQWQQHPPQHDPRGFDLGNYAPQGAGHGYGQAPGPVEPRWSDQPQPYQPEPLRFDDRDEIDQSEGKLQPYDQEPDDDYDDEEEEEPPRRRRGTGLLIVLGLVGAITLGGGLAYGYKMFFAVPPKGGTPVVKAPQQPTKTQPADPGGKKFANTDSKVMDRLPSDGASTGANPDPAGDEATGGARRVQIIPVTRDGALAAPPPAAAPSAGVVVPGMTVVNGGVRVPPPAPSPPAETASQTGRVPVAPLRPQIVAKAEPDPEPAPPPAAPRRPPPAAAAAPPAEPPPAQTRSAAASATAAPKAAAVALAPDGAAAPKATSGAFVAVLASQKSRMEALSFFADLQQRYGNLLSDKVPDVQEADLSSRNLGTVYRLVVGPPGPRERALNLCNQLKTAGYQGCWVTAY